LQAVRLQVLKNKPVKKVFPRAKKVSS
jgi:hypothetical protein